METTKVPDERFSGQTIGQIVAQNYRTSDVFKSYGIDFCCGGDVKLEKACSESNIDQDILEKELVKKISEGEPYGQQFDTWKLDFLMDFIVEQHHRYMREALPEIDDYMQRVCKIHGIQHPELKQIHWYFDRLNEDFNLHMKFEEEKAFPLIKTLLNSSNENKYGEQKNTKETLRLMEDDHGKTGKRIAKIKSLSNNYTPPEDACNTYIVLYNKLRELEADIKKHVHLENNILTPKAMRLVS